MTKLLKALYIWARAELAKLAAVVYPLTRKKLHRLFNWLGAVSAAALIIVVYLKTSGWETLVGTATVLTVWLSRASGLFAAVNRAVDALPIPEDSAPETATTPTPVTRPETPSAKAQS